METEMMRPELVLGRRIRVNINNKDFFYRVVEILDIDSTHIYFLDKYNEQRAMRIQDIREVF